MSAQQTSERLAAIVVNPLKMAGEDLQPVLTELAKTAGYADLMWLETTADDIGHGQTRQALAAGVEVVIAAGGDGTVRAVAEVLAGTDTPLGLLPLGTGNLLARNLSLPLDDYEAALELAFGKHRRKIDVAYATVGNSDEEQLFLVMAGMGFDAAIMSDTSEDLKDKIGWLAYVDAGIRNLPGKPVRADISVNGKHIASPRIRSVLAGNCGRLPGGLEIFPEARIDDGVLDFMTIAPRGRLGWLGVVAGLLRRGRSKDPSVDYFRGGSVDVRTERVQEVQLDGDPAGESDRLRMRVEPAALTIMVGAP